MALEISADIPAHDADLIDDRLTSLVINHRWRRIMTPLILRLCNDGFWSGTQAEIEDATYKATNLLFDLYDVDAMHKVAARLFGTFPMALPANTVVPVVFKDPALNTKTYDFGGVWASSDPTLLTIPAGAGGIYSIHAAAFFDAAPAGLRILQVAKNGTEFALQVYGTTDKSFSHSPGSDIEMVAGDTFGMSLFSATALTVFFPIWFTLHRVFK